MRKELLPDEQVIAVTRPQPRVLILPALVFVAVPALAAYACAWIIKGGPARVVPLAGPDWTVWLAGACVVLAAWVLLGYCLPRALTWHATRYTLTTRRVVARYGMLRRRDQQVYLSSVRTVEVRQTLLQRVLRSGNISLDTGYSASTVVPDVPEVATFRIFILEAIAELPLGGHRPEGTLYNPELSHPEGGPYVPRHWETREGGRDER